MQFHALHGLPAHILAAAVLSSANVAGQGVGTAPIGVQPLHIRGSSDNVLSLPMPRAAVFKGFATAATSSTLGVSVDSSAETSQSPGWEPNQFVYDPVAGQRQTYYLEILSGALEGVSFQIVGNDESTLQLETEGDDLTSYSHLGSIAENDRVQIRPYWRICDVFEVEGEPVIEPRPNRFLVRDEILLPGSADVSVGINKSFDLIVHYVAGEGWRAAGKGTIDYADHVLRPGSAFIVRRRNAADLTLWNAGAASMNRAVTFVPGGDGGSANDTYVSVTHPTAVTLDESGLRSIIHESTSDFVRQDELLAFSDTPGGLNSAPSQIYYYQAGEGWKRAGSAGTVGATVTLEPGRGYILRKKAANPGGDWVKEPNW